MKISASVLGSPEIDLEQTLITLDRVFVDYIHVDCKDGYDLSKSLARIRRTSKTPIDLHIISDKPEKYYDLIREFSIEMTSVQAELLPPGWRYPDDLPTTRGLSIASDTEIGAFETVKDQCSFIILMTTTPGKSGGSFNTNTFNRIREFASAYPRKRIHVDGGVNREISFALRSLGVYCAVSGSYLVQSEDIPGALLNLRSSTEYDSLRVEDLMIPNFETPLINEDEAKDLKTILQSMNDRKTGFSIVVDSQIKLVGVITDGDIRRSMINNVNDLNKMNSLDLINRDPISVQVGSSIQSVLSIIEQNDSPILFIPVVDKGDNVVGTLLFNDLMRGEL